MPRRLARGFVTGLKAVGVVLMGALVLLLGLIQASNWINWWHARALLKDVQALPAQPMWPDAQRLMTRWGAWGHYEGTCAAEHCQYTIQVADPILGHIIGMNEHLWNVVTSEAFLRVVHWLGYREAAMYFGMHVHHGRVIFDAVVASIIPTVWGADGVMASSTMRYTLAVSLADKEAEDWQDNEFMPNASEDLVDHPDYMVGRGICSGCVMDQVAFTPFASVDVRDRYRRFDLSCFALWLNTCRKPSDLLPALRAFDEATDREWARHDTVYRDSGQAMEEPSPPCRVNGLVVGRDSNYVLAVEPIRTEQKPDETVPELQTWTRVRVREVLKRPAEQRQAFIQPKSGDELEVAGEALPLGSGLLLPTGGEITMVSDGFELSSCKPLLDTPATREQVKQGIAQDVLDDGPRPNGNLQRR
ncbi:hypothetical protein SAMN05421819_3731 [Bryocella elongata]|uniref:Uncharacterized protein n=1 Tax=Bryocella elongata TaxID=863522 RepID=A0A1H6BIQ7_9BACT|nr:hypothetical protein [Bryocella elongata]SEG60482.1 hypothetical protein SAMN05421819_3731 [Bryocella elongata]